MKYTYTVKGFDHSLSKEDLLQKYILRLEKYFITYPESIPSLAVFIKKHEKHTYFSCSIRLHIKRKMLIVNCGGHTIDKLFQEGFEKIEKMLVVYKHKNFSGDSNYPGKETIRKPAVVEAFHEG